MAKKSPGLQLRGKTWWIDKRIRGYGRICESCGTDSLEEAERYLAKRLDETWRTHTYGDRPNVTFEQAASKYLAEYQEKKTLDRDVYSLRHVMPFIGDLPIDRVHNGTLANYKQARREAGAAAGTINKELATVRRILMLAARVWRHENGRPYLDSAPLIEMLADKSPRKPYPLSWDEQSRLITELPPHLQDAALLAINTGMREGELCALRWEWEIDVPELDGSVFLLPDTLTKNGQERIVLLNSTARSVLNARRRLGGDYVLSYKGERLSRLNNSAFRKARKRAGLEVRVHDLRHTFGHRLRAAGISYEDRRDLLGHKSGRITTHYSAPDLQRLQDSVESITRRRKQTILRVAS